MSRIPHFSYRLGRNPAASLTVCLIVGLATLIAGCSSDGPTSSQEETSSELAARVKATALSYEWILAAFGGQDSSMVLAGSPITLRLSEDGLFGGSAGCNAYSGTWEIVDSAHVDISGLSFTEMACMGAGVMDQETRYLQHLAAVSRMRLDDGDLILAPADEARWLRFTPADSARTGDDGAGGDGGVVDGVVDGDSTIVDGGDSTATDSLAGLTGLTGPVWRLRFLETVEEAGNFSYAVPQDVEITARFDGEGNVSGRAACNQYSAAYGASAEGGLETGMARLTKMFCQVSDLMQWESRFIDQLALVQSYRVEGERLMLSHDEGALHFEATQEVEPSQPEAWPEPDLRLTRPDGGDHIELPLPGQLIEIALPAQPSTGLGWYMTEPDSTTLQLVGERYDGGDEDLVGAVGTQRFLFEAVAPGQATLRFHYARSWESVAAADTFEVRITVNGGIVPPPPVAPLDIRLGSSFGECLGYCWQEMILDAEAITLVTRGWDLSAYPEKIHQEVMDKDLWAQLQGLADFNAFARMDEVYGCPDCADGGAEWVTMSLSGRQKTVRMEYGVHLKPITELLRILREARGQLAERAD
ncbi:MAG: META domain-containing protein [Gemmatimonadetes bacterium]|nr:META domain-containing protein [Gemmatimonadota bacterium]